MTSLASPATTFARPRLVRRAAVLSLAGIGIMALMAYLIWSGYREAIRGAEITTRDYALVIEERLDATLRRTDAQIGRAHV